MPKYPEYAERVNVVTGSIFERFGPKMRAQGDNLVKLHIGDACLHPPYTLPFAREFREMYHHFNQYCNTYGVSALREALVEKVREDNFPLESSANVMVTASGSNALSAALMTLLEAGDEVIVLTPAWPFTFGMARVTGATLREVPVYMDLYQNAGYDLRSALEEAVSPRTAALVLNSPNNPSGKVLSAENLQMIADLAKRHNLWVVSDEAYDGLTYDGRTHISIAGLPEMADRTLTIFTFSKVFMFAGVRLGYVTGAAEALTVMNRIMVHQHYSAQAPGQYMLIEPVRTRHQWMRKVQKTYSSLRDIAAEEFNIPFYTPEAGYFIFFPIDNYLRGRDYWNVVEECLDAGVSLAPGESFGSGYETWVRLCFTGESPERLKLGLRRLNKVLGV